MPTKLGKYEIRRELGQGAMGVVYEGYDPMIQRRVALKTIRSEQLAGDDAAGIVARFRREAQAAGRLSHPNIVSIYEFGEDAGVLFIAMEFVDGRALKDAFDAGLRFPAAQALRITAQILDALGYSHRQGVIHRDVKPANIILLPDGAVKVADFGIAHIESSELTQLGTVLGTPSYMSPEQILGLPVDGRSDLFSAGVILYQFLTGDRPFAGSATTTVQKVLKEDPLPPSSLNPQVSPGFDAIIRRALAKRPEDRYATADEFAAALRAAEAADESAATGETLVAPPVAIRPPAAAPAAPAAPGGVAPPATRGTAAPRGNRAAVMIVAVIALVGVVAAAWFLVPSRARESAAVPAGPAASGATAASSAAIATAAPAPASVAAAPAVGAPNEPASVAAAPAAAPPNEPGTMLISGVGLLDPADPRYSRDEAQRQTELRAAAKTQVVEKALGLFVDPASVAKNYDALNAKLLSRSGTFISRVVQESAPTTGKDGLMSITTQAVVNVKALQKSLNQMSRDERIEFIRAKGNPRVSVRIVARTGDGPDAPARPSAIAENVIKEHIKSFGFRTWSEEAAGAATQRPEFAVEGEVAFRKLSTRLEASGLVITKYALTSWTVKCIDRETGEEIYYNTTLPNGVGSFASEEEGLKAIGAKIAEAFSRDFFLQHLVTAGAPVTLRLAGMPDAASAALLGRELIGLPSVIAAALRTPGDPLVHELKLAGSGTASELVAAGIMKPLNAKLGTACLSLGNVAGDDVTVVFAARCADAAVLSRLETYPPAALYAAPPGRQKAVTANPETLRKLTI